MDGLPWLASWNHYKPKYMYVVGIVPGSNQPSLTDLNPYIKPLVNQMEQSWHRGTHFSLTAGHSSGWLTFSAIVATVMDLPAVCHTSQLASFSTHHSSTVFQCYHTLNLSRIDCINWKERDNDALCKHTEEWRDASSSKDHEKVFTTYGTQ